MSLDGIYDDENAFAKILRQEAPAVRVYEDAGVLAFMDLFPQSTGHVLVIPKADTARNILDIDVAHC
jgi:histidine triad (HIT) family protein